MGRKPLTKPFRKPFIEPFISPLYTIPDKNANRLMAFAQSWRGRGKGGGVIHLYFVGKGPSSYSFVGMGDETLSREKRK
jgi:hypothetical protein